MLSIRLAGRRRDRSEPYSRADPNTFDRFALLANWVERKIAPGLSVIVTARERSLPLCSYPSYPRYRNGSPAAAESYSGEQ